jgi:hypothetical protein
MKIMNPQISQYINALSDDRKEAVLQLSKCFTENLPTGFEETFNYGMIGYVVPLSIYPKGYHCSANTPLPFINIASQKSHIAIYHMGIYADAELLKWFTLEFSKNSTKKLDMGKSCIRFKKHSDIPFNLISELATKMSVNNWIDLYEKSYIKQ